MVAYLFMGGPLDGRVASITGAPMFVSIGLYSNGDVGEWDDMLMRDPGVATNPDVTKLSYVHTETPAGTFYLYHGVLACTAVAWAQSAMHHATGAYVMPTDFEAFVAAYRRWKDSTPTTGIEWRD